MEKNYFKVLCIFILIFSLSIACIGAKESAAKEINSAPDFKLQDLNQNEFSLSSYKDKQPVLLFFWTTWCRFCRRELTMLNERYHELIKNGLEVLAIDIGEPAYKVEDFVKIHTLNFKVLLDRDADVAQSYGILGVPTYVIVDKKGNLVFQGNYFPQNYNELVLK